MIIDNAKSAILLPPLSFLENAPFVTMFGGVVENNVLVTYPVSLYTRDNSGKMNWLGFLYAFLFTGKDGKRVCSVTYPLCFDDTYKKEIYGRLLKETEELASAFKASRMVYQGYRCVTGEILHPVSTITFGNIPNEDFLEFVKDNHFVQKEVKSCYEILSPAVVSEESIAYTIPDFYERRRKYLELCRLSDSFAQLFDLESIIRQPPGLMDRFYFKEEWVVFTESENEKGVLRWFPQSSFNKGNKAKVARMLFYNATPEFIWRSITETLKRITLAGIPQIHLADIPESFPESKLKDMGASKVYETVHMVKYY